MKPLCLLFLLFCTIEAEACINVYRTSADGELISTEHFGYSMPQPRPINLQALRHGLAATLHRYQETDSIQYYSNYGAALVYLGEYDQAKAVYTTIESIQPGLYTTASNLGTIYELIGKPDSAWYWLQKAIALEPGSHQGSEWIHSAILKYKLNPKQQSAASIIGLDFGNGSTPVNINHYNLNTLRDHLYYQLTERTFFVKPPDDVVGSLYFDLGNVIALTKNLENAQLCYIKAKEYGLESNLLDRRIAKCTELTMPAWFSNQSDKIFHKYFIEIFLAGIGTFFMVVTMLVVQVVRTVLQRRKK